MTDESYLDLGFGLTLWVSEMIQDGKQQFFKRGAFSDILDPCQAKQAKST
jgi:hypothetical protein